MRILIAEDDSILADGLSRSLRHNGYAVDAVRDGLSADSALAAQAFDLLILDLGLPQLAGLEVLRRLRARNSALPVLILTAADSIEQRVKGLDLGADDYLVKPFSATELLARVRAVLRRAQPPTDVGQNRFFTHDNLKIDFARAEVWIAEEAVSLSATEYRLLLQFAHNIGKILTSEELLSSVWGAEYKNDKEILWVSIARLRQKLEEDAHSPRHIVTRSGLGYLMPPNEA